MVKKHFRIQTLPLALLISLASSAGFAAAPQQQPITAAAPIPAPQPIALPNLPTATPIPPNLNAKGYVLMDAYTGKILASSNLDQRLSPASLTKMMTSYVVSTALRQGRIHLDDLVPISEAAWKTGGSKMFVKVGDRVPVRDLMQGIIVDSGNDACVAMAEYVAGSQEGFVNLMNMEATHLGMTGTHFMDVNGLPDPNHYTTARDMATLARALILDFPEDYQWYSQKWFTYNNIKQPNRNRLLWRDPSVDGVKTGHTDDAGFCLVASAQRNGMRLISVVMGTPSDEARAQESEQLLTYGFRFFESHKLYTAGNTVTQQRVLGGIKPQVALGVARDFYVNIPAGQYNNLKPQITLATPAKAPITKGQTLGQINIMLNGQVVASAPLIALQDDPKGSLWRRFVDHIESWFH